MCWSWGGVGVSASITQEPLGRTQPLDTAAFRTPGLAHTENTGGTQPT